MLAAHSLVPGLDHVVSHADPARRAEAVRRISDLFVQGAAHFRSDHVALFDDILTRLVPETDIELRRDLAARLALLTNAPPGVVDLLVRDQEISIAGPLLRASSLLDEATMVEISLVRGQPYLMAISERPTLSSPITDVIVRRGDRDVVRKIASNAGAEFSPLGFNGLIGRSAQDGVLALTVGLRPDLSAPLLKELLAGTNDMVRRRLFEVAPPSIKIAINRAMKQLSGAPKRLTVKRDFAPAQRAIVALLNAGRLNEDALRGFARAQQYEETVAALSAMTGVRLETLDQLMAGERHDPILILGKALGAEWNSVNALIGLRLGADRTLSAPDLEEARLNYQQLSPAAAQRVLGFWRMRQLDE